MELEHPAGHFFSRGNDNTVDVAAQCPTLWQSTGGAIVKAVRIAAFALIAGLMASACDTLMVPSARPISKIESRELPRGVVTDRVVRQLAEVLLTTPHDSSGPRPRYPLQDLWFWTIPRATGIAGLCRTDRVIFYFSAASEGDKECGPAHASRWNFSSAPLPLCHRAAAGGHQQLGGKGSSRPVLEVSQTQSGRHPPDRG